MKKIFLIPFALSFIYCSNQMKLNKGKDVDIILRQGHFPIQEEGKPIEYLIKNNTEFIRCAKSGDFAPIKKNFIFDQNKAMKDGYVTRNQRLPIKPLNGWLSPKL